MEKIELFTILMVFLVFFAIFFYAITENMIVSVIIIIISMFCGVITIKEKNKEA